MLKDKRTIRFPFNFQMTSQQNPSIQVFQEPIILKLRMIIRLLHSTVRPKESFWPNVEILLVRDDGIALNWVPNQYLGGLAMLPDGTIFVSVRRASKGTIFKIPPGGGAPVPFVTNETIGIPNVFNPFDLLIAPPSFSGPNVNPGDLMVADNGFGKEAHRAVWAINPSTGETKAITKGKVFLDGPLRMEIGPNNKLFIYQNNDSGSSRIVCLDAEGKLTPFVPNILKHGQLA